MSILVDSVAEPTTDPLAGDRLKLVRFSAPHYEAARPIVLADLTTPERHIAQGGSPQLVPGERDRGNIRLDVPWAGEIPTLDRHGNARLSFTLRLMTSDPVADADAIVAAILTAPSRCAIEWRRGGRPTYFPLRGDADWTPGYSMRERRQGGGMTVAFSIEVAPWSHRGSMDIADDFAVDSLGDYTFDAGANTLSVSGGQLVPSSTATKSLYHSARGFRYADAQGTLRRVHGTTASNALNGVILRRLDAANYLLGGLIPASNVLVIYKSDGDVTTQLASTAITALTAGQAHWMRFRAEGNVLTAEHWMAEPTPMGAPATTISHTLTGADAAKFGAGIVGDAGFRLVPGDLTERYDDFRVQAYIYRNALLPQILSLGGSVPGDLPALCDVVVTPSGGTAAPVSGLFGWSPRPGAATNGVAPVGLIEVEATGSASIFTASANGGARGGSYLAATANGAGSAWAWWGVDSDSLPSEDVTVEVFARIFYNNTHTGLAWVLWADPRNGTDYGARRYGDRGSAGLAPAAVTAGVWRFIRLGRIRLGGQQRLGVSASWTAGTGVLGIDYLVLVPSGSFATSPIGTALDASYPRFVPTTAETTRTLLHDGQSRIGPPAQTALLEHGLGRRIELPVGSVDLVAKLSSLVIDRPESDAATEQLSHAATVRASVLPRFAYV